MKQNKSQLGSAHLIIIIVLVLALLCALGFVFWQNFMQVKKANSTKSTVATTTSTTIATKSKLDQIAYDQSMGSNLAIKYPSSWTLVHENAANVGSQTMVQTPDTNTLTSPDGNVVVELKVGISGIGGTCPPIDSTTPLVSYIDIAPINNYSSAHLVSYVFNNEGTYRYNIHVVTSSFMNIKVGDPVECDFGFFQDGQNDTSSLSIKLNNVENGKAATLQDFRLAISSNNYKTAKQIVQSLYVK